MASRPSAFTVLVYIYCCCHCTLGGQEDVHICQPDEAHSHGPLTRGLIYVA
jgi:hypothetical protein